MGTSAHDDHVEHAVVESRVVGLRDIGDFCGKLCGRHAFGIASADLDFSGIVAVEAQNTAEHGAFADTVRAEYADDLSGLCGKTHVAQDLLLSVSET